MQNCPINPNFTFHMKHMQQIDKNKKTVDAYDKNPQFYADKFGSYEVRREDIDRALTLNLSGSSNTLELGSGSGRDAKYVVIRVGKDNYLGLDASVGLVELSRKEVPNAEFHVRDIRRVNFEAETFGIIFAFAILLHMKHEEMVEMLQKCLKWLKIGGILYISSKYGDYREVEVNNLGDLKYYYPYKPEDIEVVCADKFETVYKVIHDTDYGPTFTIALRKI